MNHSEKIVNKVNKYKDIIDLLQNKPRIHSSFFEPLYYFVNLECPELPFKEMRYDMYTLRYIPESHEYSFLRAWRFCIPGVYSN